MRRKLLFPCLLLLYTLIMLYLFWMQCMEMPDFQSDMPAYVNEVAGIPDDFEFSYPLFFSAARLLAAVMGAPAAVAVTTALFNGAALCAAKHYMNREVSSEPAATAGAFALFLVSNLYTPRYTTFFGFSYIYRCMGIYTPNPFWNATYMAVRPFVIICFFQAAKLLEEMSPRPTAGTVNASKEGAALSFRKYLPFAISLLLATLTKPSYTLVLVCLLAVLLPVKLVRNIHYLRTGTVSALSSAEIHPLRPALKSLLHWALALLPTGLVLLYQYSDIFTGQNALGEETGIGIAFGKVWSNFSGSFLLSVVMGMAFPLAVLLFNHREFLRNRLYRFAWWNYLTGMVLFLFLYEKGFRMLHANFSWGYMHGMFAVFMVSIPLLIRNTQQWYRSRKLAFLAVEWGLLLYHLACGINFLGYALAGNAPGGF